MKLSGWLMPFVLPALWSASALAQAPVYFDDFDGNAMLPHWTQPPPSAWAHNVSNSMLNVTGLFSPSSPNSPSNFTGMSAAFAAQGDFRVDAWMGWEAGSQPHRLELNILGPFGGGSPILAWFGYRNEFAGDPVIFAGVGGGGGPLTMPAPAPGIHHFTITRTGTQVNFFFNGSPFASFGGTSGIAAAHVGFFFVAPYPGEQGAFHIDRIQVVPSPGSLSLLMLPLLRRGAR